MAAKRSTQMTIIGVSVFIIGAGLVFLGLHGKKAAPQAAPATSPTQSAQVGTTLHAAGSGTTSVPIVIPDGYSAVSVNLDNVAGLSGHAVPGDLINLYATVKSSNSTKGLTAPFAKLILSKVRVLDITGVAADGSGSPVYLLALTPSDAERVIFFAKFESMWAALVPANSKPASTAGVSYANDVR